LRTTSRTAIGRSRMPHLQSNCSHRRADTVRGGALRPTCEQLPTSRFRFTVDPSTLRRCSQLPLCPGKSDPATEAVSYLSASAAVFSRSSRSAPMFSGASSGLKHFFSALRHISASSAETERGQPEVNLGLTCTALPMEPATLEPPVSEGAQLPPPPPPGVLLPLLVPPGRGLHSSVYRLDLRTFCGLCGVIS